LTVRSVISHHCSWAAQVALAAMQGLESVESIEELVQTDEADEADFLSQNSLSTSSVKKVQFRSSATLFEDFVPYGDIYGVHPAMFEFDSHGNMVERVPSWSEVEDLLSVGLGNFLECTATCGVSYRSRPSPSSQCTDFQALEEGDQVEVLERRGDWFRDSVGWLPLIMDNAPMFSVRYL